MDEYSFSFYYSISIKISNLTFPSYFTDLSTGFKDDEVKFEVTGKVKTD